MTAAAELRKRLDIPVMVDNDANLGALAEAAFGAGRDAGDLIYLKVSSGIGAGLILNGRLYRGSAGLAGELGHVLVNPDGIVCRCGNRGCLETVAATGALVDLLRRSHGDDLTVAAMLEAARDGDAGCAARDRRCRPRARPGRRHAAERAQPRDARSSAATSRRAGDLLLDGVRESVRARRCRRPRAAPSSWPACSASAPRCSARSRWWSRRPTAPCRPGLPCDAEEEQVDVARLPANRLR